MAGAGGSRHTASTVGKQREMNTGAQATFPFSFSLGPRPLGRCCLTFRVGLLCPIKPFWRHLGVTQRTGSMVMPSPIKFTRKVNNNRPLARCQGPKRQQSSPDIFQGSGYRLLGITINRGTVPVCTNPCDILQPPGLRRAGHPSEECGCSTEVQGPCSSHFPSPPPPPTLSFRFLSCPSVDEGENKNVVHSRNCRPLCGLSILALLKFRVVCSGDKP